MEHIVSGKTKLEVDASRGTFRVTHGGDVIIPWSTSAVTLTSGERVDTGAMTSHGPRRTDAGELEVVHDGTLVQRFRASRIPGGIEMDMAFRPARKDLAVKGLHHIAAEGRSVECSALEPGKGLWMWRHGTVSPGDPVLCVQLDSPDILETHDRYRWLIEEDERVGLTSEMLAVFRSGKGAGCLVGFTTLARQACGFVVTHARGDFDVVHVESRCDLEGLSGDTVAETLLILPTDDPWRAAEAWAERIAETYKPRFATGPLVGWSDWQYYRRDVTEVDVLENLDALAREQYPVEYVLIDDGYQRNMSDWLVPNERFPHGAKWLAERIRQEGYKAGIWIAPLTAHETSALVREHPDWLLRNAAGKPVENHTHMGIVHTLDFTVSEAAEWLRALVRTLVDDYGYRWIKLDGPIRRYYEGGVFRSGGVTSVEHIRLALEIIREAAGDAVVEGEGYYGPSVGLVDTQRVTQDIQQDWPRLRHTAQVNLLSTFMHRRWWVNNPDAFILRDTPTPHYAPDGNPEHVMSQDELQTELTALALSGGVVMLTDRMAQLADERKTLVDAFLPVYPSAAKPVDLLAGKTCPEVFHQKVHAADETYDVIAVFNWEESPRAFVVALTDTDLEPATKRVAFEYWTQVLLGVVDNTVNLGEIPAHGVRVLALRPLRDHPFVMGTSIHLTQGGVELHDQRWEGNNATLSFRTSSWAACPRLVHVYVPEGHGHPDAKGNHLAVQVKAGAEAGFEVRFQR